MDLGKSIIINELIMALIESKYLEPTPGIFTPPDFKYYTQLEQDTAQARRVLGDKVPSAEWIKDFIIHCNVTTEARTDRRPHEHKRGTTKVSQKV